MTVALVVAMAMPQFAMSVHAEETDGVVEVSANEIHEETAEILLRTNVDTDNPFA